MPFNKLIIKTTRPDGEIVFKEYELDANNNPKVERERRVVGPVIIAILLSIALMLVSSCKTSDPLPQTKSDKQN